ncbi:MAG TPA: hypothetical protein VN672_06545 [Solirubrobacteraceae bacterium]|nr:hypothetical protein [Solirubrobacteraceae bacterium]
MSSIVPAVFTGVTFLVALRRLPLLHPIQLWSGSWAVSTALYSLRLLPYRSLSWLTAGLICGSVVVFAVATPLGARIARRRRESPSAREDAAPLELAAWLALGLLALTLAVFLAQLVSRFGLTRALRITVEVKVYLASAEAPLSGVYVEAAVAGAALCALAGARAGNVAARRRWLIGALACAATAYFSTSRGFIAIGLIAALTAVGVAGVSLSRRTLLAMGLAAAVTILTLFFGLGAVIGKTYGSSGIGQFDNFFSRNPAVSSLALPYEDLTAGIPALDVLVHNSTTWGRAHGCATAPIACGVVRKLGVPAVRVPVTAPFTRAPLQWNAYTFLDRFLIDGGTALTLVLVAATGTIAGYLWARARAGATVAILVYSISAPALVFAYRQNLIELVLLAAVLAAVLLLLARVLAPLTTSRSRRPVQPAG